MCDFWLIITTLLDRGKLFRQRAEFPGDVRTITGSAFSPPLQQEGGASSRLAPEAVLIESGSVTSWGSAFSLWEGLWLQPLCPSSSGAEGEKV